MNAKEAMIMETLDAEKRRLTCQLEGIKGSGSEDSFTGSLSELSLYDNHPADIGTEMFERSKDIALMDTIQGTLDDIDRAMQALSSGIYGLCQDCGRDIDPERLRAVPWAVKCLQCQRREERHDDGDKRPLEESSLIPAFQRTFLDDSPAGFTGFDGEDSLQAVIRYGSSDTPQDLPGSHDYDDLYPDPDERIGIVDDMDRFAADDSRQSDPAGTKRHGRDTRKTER
ncbi:TraR/DksA C4-type zinc finger protein [Acetonema longum]|uniref:Zinc finger DksA/TraR C4-type domain-containing protein n=1 Tax=Acetonema longum DSM 6540 TaxID=1009370 RepID=F7NLC4_9FIRM|nr:TraR/DksA C4-type zinc finger protein [Acetonema longum]EGO63229.1 hypothetical protein ALO_14482 [Acetonema longum DSM 6540]